MQNAFVCSQRFASSVRPSAEPRDFTGSLISANRAGAGAPEGHRIGRQRDIDPARVWRCIPQGSGTRRGSDGGAGWDTMALSDVVRPVRIAQAPMPTGGN
ncbi:hypothetical protein F1559_001191 [Cyanidiococcus yangmingshanensis]|uniref:Uncharacterized protein n=1 Tax=Cyanidiococcus yangmingshanensis TaxID=2690220 RepID=A0A7J7IG10_9RHOD|nr:hypothetical protein F1559_001191 [Cyanidiococcus yangmingshanensis]